jgi:hypothetical protein
MKLNNPFAQHDLVMQDIKGDHYGLMNPALKILRAEGVVCLLLACALYQVQGFSWMTFGLWAYNTTHSTLGAGLLALLGLGLHVPTLLQASLIWFAHIGFDRALGFGLKFPLGFRVTHLGVLRGMRDKA